MLAINVSHWNFSLIGFRYLMKILCIELFINHWNLDNLRLSPLTSFKAKYRNDKSKTNTSYKKLHIGILEVLKNVAIRIFFQKINLKKYRSDWTEEEFSKYFDLSAFAAEYWSH